MQDPPGASTSGGGAWREVSGDGGVEGNGSIFRSGKATDAEPDPALEAGWMRHLSNTRALEFYISALETLGPEEHRVAFVTCCLHVARCFSDRAAMPPARREGKERERTSDKKGERGVEAEVQRQWESELRWQLRNLGEALWYYKRAVHAADDSQLLVGKQVASAALHGTALHNTACVRLRALAIMLTQRHLLQRRDRNNNGRRATKSVDAQKRAEAKLQLRLRTWMKGWSWRRCKGDERGWEHDDDSDENSGQSEGMLSDESDDGVVGMDGLDLAALDDSSYGGGDSEEYAEDCADSGSTVPIIRQDEAWEVREAERAVELCEEAAELFRRYVTQRGGYASMNSRAHVCGHTHAGMRARARTHARTRTHTHGLTWSTRRARCKIEQESALKSRDLAGFVAGALHAMEDCGSIAVAKDSGCGSIEDIRQWALSLPELPMPHVMACFDVSFHSERRGRLPALTIGDSEEGDTSLEDEATLYEGGKLKNAASNSNLTDADISFAGRKNQAFTQIMVDMAFRKAEVRSSWRLARFCAMVRSSDCDARYWALLQLDEMLVNLGMSTHPFDS